MADIADKITDVRNTTRPVSTTASGTRAAGGTSLACNSLTGWPTASKVHFVTYQIDSNSNPVSGTQLDCSGIVSGSTIGSFEVIDGTDAGNSVGDVVEMLPTSAWGQDLADALTSEHDREGAHTDITGTSLNVTSTVTTDTISEKTPANGITVDNLNIKDGKLNTDNSVVTANITNANVTADKLSTGAATATVSTQESTTSGTAADLATVGPSVTVTIGANGLALLLAESYINNNATENTVLHYVASGANTIAATAIAQSRVVDTNQYMINGFRLLTGLTPGSTTFKLQYSTSGGGTAFFNARYIVVVPL